MKCIAYCVFAAACIVAVSCSDDDASPVDPGPVLDLVPLAVGNQWHYELQHWRAGSLDSSNSYETRIDSSFVEDGHTWYVNNRGSKSYLDSDGLHTKDSEGETFIKYPVNVNDTFAYVVGDPYFFTMTCLSTDTLIATPAGEFHCYRYHYTFDVSVVDTYIAPGIGTVRWEDKRPGDPEVAFISVLTGYEFPG